jgi:glycerol-3-phosphate dehydrogenase
VDLAVKHAGLTAGPCWTTALPLVGAPSLVGRGGSGVSTSSTNGAGSTNGLGSTTGAGGGLPDSLVARYGAEAAEVLAAAVLPGSASAVGQGITGAAHLDITRAEIEWAVTHEGALDADDVLDRRTRIGLVPADRAAVRDVVEELVADSLARTTR